MRGVRLLLVLLGLLWTGILALLFALAGAAGTVVVRVTRWLDFEPTTTQWLADGLAAAGTVAQWLFAIVWAAGIAALVAVHVLVRRLPQRDSRAARDAIIDGEVRRRGPTEPE